MIAPNVPFQIHITCLLANFRQPAHHILSHPRGYFDSEFVACQKLAIFSLGSRAFSSCDTNLTKPHILSQNHGVFLTLTMWFLCLNPKAEHVHGVVTRKKSKYFAGTNVKLRHKGAFSLNPSAMYLANMCSGGWVGCNRAGIRGVERSTLG